MKQPATNLEDSKQNAVNRFLSLEKRLNKNLKLKAKYVALIQEYQALGHMSEIIKSNRKIENVYYVPHHCVIKNKGLTTKLRVVLDASAKSHSGLSLNDVLHVGPNIQDDLFDILIRFRKHKIVFIADIEKMYR